MPNIIWIATLIFYGLIQSTSQVQIRCYKDSRSNYTAITLENPGKLLNSSCFDYELPTLCYTFGYRGKVDGPATTAVVNAYLKYKKRNVLLLDWEEEADGGALGIKLGYVFKAVPNAKHIGGRLGSALIKLAKSGLNMTNVHLMGHSLGAHLMAHAGRFTRARGYAVSRITGLDPARVLFEGIPTLQKGLDRTCAKFVDIIHTNPGNYGSEKSTGTADFWPNYGNHGLQPGCPEGSFDMFSQEDLCSHNRAWQFFIETLFAPTSFPAVSADTYEEFVEMDGRANFTAYMGELVSTKAKGNYYLTTNAQEPFGMGEEGTRPSNQARRRRTPYKKYTTTLIKLVGFYR
ncbi:phospholipase A1-like [Aricia agestis]|uniref:phospholipase A1-like n=1 Tax=Aricia agestis TaxID=91739 RepID=UPI001C2096BE|nr:phospholipase A1-like [Aricia agestis]